MIRNFIDRGALAVVLGVTILALSACVTTVPVEKRVEDRAMARWNTLLNTLFSDDWAGAYEYFSPGYRSSVSFKQYQRVLLLSKVKWNEAEYIESDCTETTCKVKISLKYTVYAAVPGVRTFDSEQVVQESWLLSDGEWYLVPEK